MASETETENLTELAILTRRLLDFRDRRSWQQFHSLKELILSLNLEAGELLELTQWMDAGKFGEISETSQMKQRLEEECADVLNYLLLIAEKAGIDLIAAAHHKIDRNEEKYPVEKAFGSAKKYTQL